ncbi:MAG: ribosomal protein S18-alanine N-acetyltransferase [Actinomycetota bacterium]|jgi:[ribosomal protein S18]-alanine N-acetyltransferase
MVRARDDRRPAPVPPDLVVHVVPMRRRHLRSVTRIESETHNRPWSVSLFMSELALRSSRAYFVARVDGLVVGYVGLMVSADEGHITTLAVDVNWHRRKIGTRLMLVAAREAVRREVKALTLEVRMSNKGAQELYRAFGFRPAGVRKNYYVESSEDALIMWAEDVDQPAFAERLDAVEATVPGRTLYDDGGPSRG